jgi:hypothetical protein
MSDHRAAIMPRARSEALVVEALADETLVYDVRRHKAHCLNRAAALVWQCCDGRTRVTKAAALLERELGIPGGDALVWTGLDQLARARLLEDAPPFAATRSRYSRRDVIRALGLGGAAALLPPLVDSIVSPVAAQVGSCLTSAECSILLPPLCNGQPICGTPGMCCTQVTLSCRSRAC